MGILCIRSSFNGYCASVLQGSDSYFKNLMPKIRQLFKNKHLRPPWQGRRQNPWYHPACPVIIIFNRSGSRYRAKPGGGYCIHRRSLPLFKGARRVQPLRRSAGAHRAHTTFSRLAGRWLNTPGKASFVSFP